MRKRLALWTAEFERDSLWILGLRLPAPPEDDNAEFFASISRSVLPPQARPICTASLDVIL